MERARRNRSLRFITLSMSLLLLALMFANTYGIAT